MDNEMQDIPNFEYEIRYAWRSGEDNVTRHASDASLLSSQIKARREQIAGALEAIASNTDEFSLKMARWTAKNLALGDGSDHAELYEQVIEALQKRYTNAAIRPAFERLVAEKRLELAA